MHLRRPTFEFEGARLLQPRSASSLGSFLQARGRRNDATGLLASIYDQFKGGIDTKDPIRKGVTSLIGGAKPFAGLIVRVSDAPVLLRSQVPAEISSARAAYGPRAAHHP